MKFIKADIFQHDAFSLGRIKRLEIDFTQSNVFIILGSNGSGKSSLLQLLCTWPDDASRYKAGGYKTVTIENTGVIYDITCQYNGQDKYILKADGIVVYKGSHGQMFASAVEQHLGFSKLYRSLLLESASVTKMNAAQRSQWLMDLSGIDYTWALGLYDQLKAKRNMFAGSAKVNAQRLTQMSQTEQSSDEVKALVDKHKALMDAVSMMHSVRIPSQSDIEQSLSELKTYQVGIKTLLERISNARYTSAKVDSFESVQSVLERLKGITIELRSQINIQHEVVQECKAVIGDEHIDSQSLADKIQSDTELLNRKSATLQITSIEDSNAAARALKAYSSAYTWVNSFSSDVETIGAVYSPATLEAAKQESFKAVSRQNELNAALERISSRIEHYEEHLKNGQIQCPNCKHDFIAGYDKSDHISSQEKLSKVKLMIEQHKAVVVSTKQTLEMHERLKELWYAWSRFVNDHTFMGRWLNAIMDRHTENKQSISSQWDRLGIEINTLVDIQELKTRINVLQEKLNLSKSKNEALVQSAIERMNTAAIALEGFKTALQRITDVITRYDTKLNNIRSYDSLGVDLLRAVSDYDEKIADVQEVYRQHYFDKALKSLQSELASVEMQIRKNDQSSALIEGIKANLEQDKFAALCWGALAKAMSPKDGIIGKSLIAFLSDFFEQINNFIAQVWTYELTIVPIEIDEEGQNEIDYNFKLIQDSKELKDISFGSEAMKYIIDLAFRLTALLRVKENGIAMLDEPFTSLDQNHRSQAVFAMKNLIESDLFDQFFIISHHTEFHDVFSSASVICLDKRNISMPSTANNNVSIEYY